MQNAPEILVPHPRRKPEGTNSPEGYVRLRDLANMLGVSKRTVQRWEAYREGPPKIKIGRQIFFRVASVEAWLISRENQSFRRLRGRSAK